MKNLKSIFSVILALVMVICFTSCASNEQKERLTAGYNSSKAIYDSCVTVFNDIEKIGKANGYFTDFASEADSMTTVKTQLDEIKKQLDDIKKNIDENVDFYNKDEADKAISSMETMKSSLEAYKTSFDAMKQTISQYVRETENAA